MRSGGGGGFRTKPRIEIEFVWTHAHCSYVKTALNPCDVRANGDETWSRPALPIYDRDRSRSKAELACAASWTWKPCLLETLAICSSKETVYRSFPESNTTACLWPELDTGNSTESFCRSRDCNVYLFPAKLSVTEKKSLAFGTLWMFLFSMQASGAGLSTFFAALLWREGKSSLWPPWERSTENWLSKVHDYTVLTIEELTNCREVSSLTHVIFHVQSLGFVDCLPWVPWNFAQLSLVQRPENRWHESYRVTTECVHACVHRRLHKKKESDVNVYLCSKQLESGNVDNCIIWSWPSFLKINFRSKHFSSFPFLFSFFFFLFLLRKPQKLEKRSYTKKRTKEAGLDVAEMLPPVTFFFRSCLSLLSQIQIRLCGSSFFHRESWFFFFYFFLFLLFIY